jgi:HEAT repeat protein
VDALLARLAAMPSGRQRTQMIEAAAVPLGRSGDLKATEFLAGLVRDRSSSRRVNRAAVQGLKEAGPAAAPAVRGLLRDGVDDAGAVWLLGEVGTVEDVKLLVPLLRRRGLRLRYNTVVALDGLGDASAVEGLLFALSDRRMFVREKALVALDNHYTDGELIDAVEQARKRVPWYRVMTHHTYRQWARRRQGRRRL